MNEWEIDPEAGLSIGWWGLLTDMARGVGDQEIWKKYKMFDQTNTGKNMKKYNIIEGQGQGSRNMEIPNVESNKCWGLKAQ